MKDIIANRGRTSPSTKIKLLGLSLRENGVLWTSLTGLYFVASALAEKSFAAADGLRKRNRLPGMNSPNMNRQIWDNWDWSAKGEEWTLSPEWKESVLSTILRKHIPQGVDVLEIGPGGGRWTGELVARARKLTAIDISEAAVTACRERFASAKNAQFLLGNGNDLSALANSSIDAIWSFDVFVHINRAQFRTYAAEFARVLRPGGVAVIHHGTLGGTEGGWRSDVTAADAWEAFTGAGLKVVDQFSSWIDHDGQVLKVGLYDDMVTIVRHL